jgi:hypothetical protein
MVTTLLGFWSVSFTIIVKASASSLRRINNGRKQKYADTYNSF